METKAMKLLVTGGAGFIGSNFILYWLKEHPDDVVTNFDKLTYAGNLENLSSVATNPHYQFIQGDICDPEAVDRAMEGVDTVVHLAAESHVDRSIMEPMTFLKTNVEGTGVLLQAARKHNVQRFHHVSTDEVFGELPLASSDMFTIDSPYSPRSPYAASKAASDHIVRAFHTTYGLPITISNCSNNYGPFHFPEKFIPLAITNILEDKKIPIYGDGMQVRDWLFVTDHCRAIENILTKGTIGSTYLVGGMIKHIPNLTLAKTICNLLGKDESMIEFVKDRPGHDRRYAIDWSKTKEELGWEPHVSLEQGLRLTIDWYKNNRAWWERVKSGAYRDYYQKQYGTE